MELDVRIDDEWSLWPWLRVRGAGFPVAMLTSLAAPEAARRADALAAAREALARAREAAIVVAATEIARSEGDRRAALGRALRSLRGATSPPPSELDGTVLAPLRAAEAEERDARTACDAALVAAQGELRRALQAIASDGAFREALAWQNRGVLHHAVDGLLRTPLESRDKEARRRETAIATYLQRYCAKNDTIGFFGPIGWGELSFDEPTVSLATGAGLIARREVYFEHWCIDVLARHLAEDPRIKPHCAPRRMPSVRLDGTTVHFPVDKRAELPPPLARLLALSDGKTSALAIARRLLADETLALDDEETVLSMLALLEDKGFVTWTLEIPTNQPRPERHLRALLEAIDDGEARAHALESLERLEAARRTVAEAAGDAAAVDRALVALDERFTEITGSAAQRRAGQTYAGRSIVYEDCVRDATLRLGRDVIERLRRPLGLVLASVRWYTLAIARRYREAFTAAFSSLRSAQGEAAVDYVAFARAVDPLFATETGDSIIDEVTADLEARWSRVLALDLAQRRVERTCDQLAAAVADAFPATGPGWTTARFHSPDLLVAADGLDGFRRGEYLIVLGELHPSVNNLLTPMALLHHPTPEALLAAYERDLPGAVVAPVESRVFSTRADNTSLVARDLHVEIGDTRSWRPRERVLAAADLVVAEEAGGLVVRTRDGARRFDLVEFFSQQLAVAGLQRFRLAASAPHHPRVTIDGFAISRESWRFPVEEVPCAQADTTLERLVAARAWARAHGIPRFAFYKVPGEPKPCYVDFESPIYVDQFAKHVRSGSSVTVSEMLPGPGEAWLADGAGRRYLCEVRVAIRDARDPAR